MQEVPAYGSELLTKRDGCEVVATGQHMPAVRRISAAWRLAETVLTDHRK